MEENNSMEGLNELISSFKKETVNILKAIATSEKERADKWQETQKALNEQNSQTINDLKCSVKKIVNIISDSSFNSSNTNSPSNESEVNPVTEDNKRRLLDTFNTALEKSADQLAKYNAEIMEKQALDINNYINSFSKIMASKFEVVIEKYTRSLEECFDRKISLLSHEMEEHLKDFTEKNSQLYREALSEVQKENNNELEKLSASLRNMSDSNNEFISKCTENNENVNHQVTTLVKQHEFFVDELKDQTDYNLKSMEMLMNDKIYELSEKLNKLEKNNAELFHNSMNEYRDNFVAANADALARVQGDLQEAVKKNQDSIGDLTKQVNYVAEILNEVIETADTQKQETDRCIQEVLKSINNSGENANKKMSNNYDRLCETVRDMIDEFNEIKELINSNTQAYNDSLKSIQENQRRNNELSKKDIELLEGVMRRSGIQ